MALSGFMANRAEAGSITLSIDFNGTVLASAFSTGLNQTVVFTQAEINNANTLLSGAGSAYQLSGLSANSNFSGAGTGFLQITGQLSVATTGTTAGTISLDATQGGFLAPVGPNGTATTSSVANLAGGASTTTTYTGDFQGAILPSPIVFTGTGPSFSAANAPTSIGSIPSGYSLSTHYVIGLADVANSSEGVTGTTTVTANAIPEPASVVMLLTGLPMPLVFMGLLRRRKAKA
jgi:hypothetical protein